MELIQIKEEFQIDVGSPTPYVLSNEFDTFLLFYKQSFSNELDYKPITIKFNFVAQYKFGSPNDEAISGHPYFKMGLEAYSIFEVKDSDWIEQLRFMNKEHPYHSDDHFNSFKHYIFFFHDTCFEIVCKGYEVLKHSSKSIVEEINRVSKLLKI